MEYREKKGVNATPDNVIKMDISSVKTLQIGYQAETIYLSVTEEDQMTINEYIGYSAYEYLAKVNANRFKTSIRYGRRESVNMDAYVEIMIPDSWHGELLLFTQYGNIRCDDIVCVDRLAVETSEGMITLKEVNAPRIRLASSSNSVFLEKAVGFTDIHTTSGDIHVLSITGGAKLETSSGNIDAAFESLSNIVECNTLSGLTTLTFSSDCNINVDGVSKRGEISSEISGIEVRMKPGNVKNVYGTYGKKPFQNVKLSSINGSITLK